MTASSSIDPSEFLHEHLAEASPDLLRQLMESFLNTLLSAEADSVCSAAYGTRDREQTNRRNGYRHRDLDTRTGTLDVALPKLREGSYFPDWLLERRRRAEAALTSLVATCYLLGVSTRRMDQLVQSLGITGLSKSQVSVMAKDLDGLVQLPGAATGRWPVSVPGCGRVDHEGPRGWAGGQDRGHGRHRRQRRRVPGDPGRGHVHGRVRGRWNTFFKDLVARGLNGVALVTSDAHAGLVEAIGANVPGASWQRCRTHYMVNLMSACPRHAWGRHSSS